MKGEKGFVGEKGYKVHLQHHNFTYEQQFICGD